MEVLLSRRDGREDEGRARRGYDKRRGLTLPVLTVLTGLVTLGMALPGVECGILRLVEEGRGRRVAGQPGVDGVVPLDLRIEP